jgi:hypothetical protein
MARAPCSVGRAKGNTARSVFSAVPPMLLFSISLTALPAARAVMPRFRMAMNWESGAMLLNQLL